MGLNLIEGRQIPKESTNQDHRPSRVCQDSGNLREPLKSASHVSLALRM